jgi:F-type H+-transporting ATPase subunit a
VREVHITGHLASGPGFVPPSTTDFKLPSIFGHSDYATKPVVLVFFSVIVISLFFILASRKAAVVPSKLQFAGESIYSFVRKDLGQEIIGAGFLDYVPFLFTLFVFVLVNNLFGIIPLIQFPTMSHVSFPYVLAIFTFVIFHAVGIKRQGVVKYLKGIAFLPGVPKFAYILLTPIEIATYFLIRPVTLSLRLFANMFAGHLLLLVFIGGGNYMLHDTHLFMKILSPFSFGFGIVMTFFEFMVQCLQAYIITLLSALFIAGALVEEH